jgi:3-methyladenine DNA glycosylase AlkD
VEWTVDGVLDRLRPLGLETVRRLKNRVGAGEAQFGVTMGNIRALAAEIKTNHELGLQLWGTGVLDARLVAILIMRPRLLSATEVDQLVQSVGVEQVADWLMSYVVRKHPAKEDLRLEWLGSSNIWAARAGWALTAERVDQRPEGLDLGQLLEQLKAEMPTAPPGVQWTMNGCLANIGIHHSEHRARALLIGEELGIYRDFPVSKGCTSPFAPIWINEIVRRRENG